MTIRVLVVDDDDAIRRVVGTGLRARGYDVAEAASAEAGLSAIAKVSPDLVILDLGLPDGDGIDVCATMREFSTAPVIVLSVERTDHRKIEALDAGADDFVTKPFSMGELLARMRAALRRTEVPDSDPVIEVGPLTVDRGARRVTVGRRDVDLTDTEYRVLVALAEHPGRVLTHTMLLDRVWGPGYARDLHYLRVYVSRLRRKLEHDPSAPELIVTVPRAGYRLEILDAPEGGG
ncbi:response regulator [Salsipaludibacter albus]|uniref:response regulator n=1 Tax=Salsipaludibacter albus TaxID=2849650 RepID=UPI001EE47AA9|nr:response regulator transcription factor [Salsipaludibacter albus]MBY5162659.1 response regulator transcription factor [Salsipaludibacter albus]